MRCNHLINSNIFCFGGLNRPESSLVCFCKQQTEGLKGQVGQRNGWLGVFKEWVVGGFKEWMGLRNGWMGGREGRQGGCMGCFH